MPVSPDQIRVIQEWARRARKDLGFAALAIRATPESFTEAACFHAQQCVEKHLKTLLLVDGQEAPKSHNIDRLWGMLPEDQRPAISKDERITLTTYAVTVRYEGADDPTTEEARNAVAVAERVQREVQQRLASWLEQDPSGPA